VQTISGTLTRNHTLPGGINTSDDESYKNKCKEIGSLGATLPTWIRNICRIRIDGTSPGVMNAQRAVIIERLEKNADKYQFCTEYLEVLEKYSAYDVMATIAELIETKERLNKSKFPGNGFICRVETCNHSPKIACMGCAIPSEILKSLRTGEYDKH
jgi:hypothetical protein